jgi:HJR/Mrr/RecB family endonuclease
MRGNNSYFEILMGWAIAAGVLAAVGQINYWAAVIVAAELAIVSLIIVHHAAPVWRWLQRDRRCPHGVPAGGVGRCVACTAETDRAKIQYEEASAQWDLKQARRVQAQKLHEQEIERLSKAWVTNTEAYLLMDPRQFEAAICELFRKLGYLVMQTPYSNDGGKDAIAEKDGRKCVIECKRYAETQVIGRRDLQIFFAAMHKEGAEEGFYINTGRFARTAWDYAAENNIRLFDRYGLPNLVNQAYPTPIDVSEARVLCIECGVINSMPVCAEPAKGFCVNGHSMISNVTKADLRIFSSEAPACRRCGSAMREVSRYGKYFWGCTKYPECNARLEPRQ